MPSKKLENISEPENDIIYQRFPCHVKGLATQAAISTLMNDFSLESVDELYEFLKNHENYNKVRLALEKNAKFYEQKLHGQPLKRIFKIIQISDLSPKAKEALNHPLWLLISKPAITIKDVAKICASLDNRTYHPLFAASPNFFDAPYKLRMPLKPHKIAIKANTQIDGYTMKLIMYFAKSAKYKRDAPLEALMQLFRETICFLAFRLPALRCWDFYYALAGAINVNHIVSTSYPKNYRYWTEKREWINNIKSPKFFGDVQEYSKLTAIIEKYQMAANWLSVELNKDLTKDMQIRLFSSIDPHHVINNSSSSRRHLLRLIKQRLVQL